MSRDGESGEPRERSDSPEFSETGDQPTKSRRRRVVLADTGRSRTVVRTLVEVEEQTSIGEALVRNLIRVQLRAALGLAGLVLVLLGALPLVCYYSPTFANYAVVGIRLPWLLLGVVPFPLLFTVGFWYQRLAERHERDFVHMVEN